MVNSTNWTPAIMDLKFNHQRECHTVGLKIYIQLASLHSFVFYLCVSGFFLEF